MSDFLLLHGMNVGAWEWERVSAALRADPRTGTVIAPEMPGRAANRPGAYAAIQIQDYIDTAVAALRDHDLRETVVVGHSGGGAYLQAAVAAEPGRVRAMVFLCAAVPANGRALLDDSPLPLRWLARLWLRVTRARTRGIVASRRLAKWAMCHDLPDADCGPLLDRLTPEPPALIVDRIGWPAARVAAPATYILTTKDRVIRPRQQRRYARRLDGARIVTFPCGHGRPVVEPAPLARLLLGLMRDA